MLINNHPQARTGELVISELDGELLVYDLKTDKFHLLNKTALFIWQNCDGKTAIEEIGAKLDRNVPAESITQLTISALAKLEKAGLIDGDPNKYTAMMGKISRREVIRNLTMTGAVALPVVASLVAPTAATAQSACPSPQFCSITRNCCPPGQRCLVGSSCCPTSQACGASCCTTTERCTAGSCCPVARVCRGGCCRPGETCNVLLGICQ